MVRSYHRVRPIETYPHADISINRNRIKKHGGTTIYMEIGTEFEIELDNNTQETWLAKIKLNDNPISRSGVLRPGEHIFIKRFLDKNKKFLFDTYEVQKSREKAIAKNGKIEIEFFRERKMPQIWFQTWIPKKPRPVFPRPFDYFFTSSECSSITTTYMGSIKGDFSHRCLLRNFPESQILSTGPCQANSIKTGRIEKGSESKQEFTSVDIDFESFCSHKLDYQIFPLSRKAFVENKKIRQYCTDCGRRKKKSENFCTRY